MVQVNFHLNLPVKIIKKKKWFLASCQILDVHSQGDTQEQAKQNLIEALSSFLISCYEMGTLEDVLKQSGFKPLHSAPTKMTTSQKRGFVDVPIPFTFPEQCRV